MANTGSAGVAYIFPGQGTQYKGMGEELYQNFKRSRAIFEQADEALGFSLSSLCFKGTEDELRQTCNAQPAILTVSYACLLAESEKHSLSTPSFVAGHSLGEYTALVAAKVLKFKDAVRLVRTRGELMQEAGRQTPGGMLAIIGLDEVTLEEVCQETGTEIANVNCSGQAVISGPRQNVAHALDLAKLRGAKRVIPLQVSGAFHCSLMQYAVEGIAKAISDVTFKDPIIPVIGNSTAQPLTTAAEIKIELINQLCRCVQWQRSVEYMVGAGVSTFVEFGPGEVLTGLIKRIQPDVNALNVSDTHKAELEVVHAPRIKSSSGHRRRQGYWSSYSRELSGA